MMDSMGAPPPPPPPPGGTVLVDAGGGGGWDFRFDPQELHIHHPAKLVLHSPSYHHHHHQFQQIQHHHETAFHQIHHHQHQLHDHQQQQLQIQEEHHQQQQQHPQQLQIHRAQPQIEELQRPDGSGRQRPMDPAIWGRLPETLVDRVVATLPLDAFFRLRSVCKRWYSLLFSDSFLELCSRAAPPRPWFLLFRPGAWSTGFLYDPDARAWHRLHLGFLPPDHAVVSSARGLLCCMSQSAGYKTVLVCNPLTRSCVQLPNTLKERFVPTVGLVVSDSVSVSDSSSALVVNGGYRLLVAGDDLISPFAVKNLTTEAYDSRVQAWRPAGALPRLCNLESAKTTYANGVFYCMNYSPFGILAYTETNGTWSKIQAPMRRFLRTPNLVECRGRLIMVAAVEKNRLNVPKSIRIWGLQHPKNSWVEMERMPQGLYEEFMRISNERAFHCIGHGNTILITIAEAPDILVYDLFDKVWRWIPRCPFVSEGEQQGLQGFAFDPRLEASVC